MISNGEVSDALSLISKLMDLHGENSFRAKSYSIAAFQVDKLQTPVANMQDEELFSQKGIGESVGKKIIELLTTGKIETLEELVKKTPEGIFEMLKVKGLGPKKIAILWSQLGIENLGELEYAANENRLVLYKGFGAKTQESILKNIAFIKKSAGWRLWATSNDLAQQLIQHCRQNLKKEQFELTGKLKRQEDTIDKIEIVTTSSAEQLEPIFSDFHNVNIDNSSGNFIVETDGFLPIHFYFSSAENFGTTVFVNSCTEDFLKAFQKKYKLPSVTTEEEIWRMNKLPPIPSCLRHDVDVLTKPQSIPQLIQNQDIKGLIHCHSSWSDGAKTIEEMAQACINKGWEYMVISDHSQSAFYAQGLTVGRLQVQFREIDMLNQKLAPFKIFKSIESDILNNGSLDYENDILEQFDLVIASVHSNLKMNEEKAMERLLMAIRNPFTTILGHPTGRLLLSREGYPLNFEKIIEACRENNVVIEINANPRRLDLDWRWIQTAVQNKVLLSVNPDAHSIEGIDDTRFGVIAAQKGKLESKNNLSSFSLKEFEEFLVKNRTSKNR